MRQLLIAGNSTMPKCVGIFNIPPLKTCTPSDWCRENCYALKRRFTWKTILEAYEWRLQESKKPDFVTKMINELNRRKSITFVRIHITGDFYSSCYVEKWAEIAEHFPSIIFRTNTRRRDLLKLMFEVFPQNVVVRESIDITRNGGVYFPVHAIKGTPGSEKYFTCSNNCEKCKFYCWYHENINVVSKEIL